MNHEVTSWKASVAFRVHIDAHILFSILCLAKLKCWYIRVNLAYM